MPNFPSGTCVPDCSSNEPTPIDSAHDQVARDRRTDEVAETCHPDTTRTKLCSVLAGQSVVVDEVDYVVRGEQDVAIKYEQAHTPADWSSVSRHTNIEAGENKVPEYMNLAVNMGHDSAAKVLGAIPKKLPAPAVPPRGTTSRVE